MGGFFMGKGKLITYTYLTDEQLIEFTLEEMGRIKKLSDILDDDEYKKRVCILNQLIVEVKRRNLYIKKPLLASRILKR